MESYSNTLASLLNTVSLKFAASRQMVQIPLANPGLTDLEIIEVQSGGYLGEDDVVRFEDVYGRSDAPVDPAA